MPTFHPSLIAHMRTHHGIVGTTTLREIGLTRSQLRALVDSHELVRLHEGVYRHALWPDTFEARCAAACAADPSVVICCGGAGRLLQYRSCSHVPLHVTSTSTAVVVDGIPLHRCPVMPVDHVIDRGDGIRLTAPRRFVFDIAKHVGWTQLESIIEQGLRRHDFDVPALYATGRLLCRQGRAGSALFGAVLRSRPAWRRPVDSHPELVLLSALARAGLHLQTQVELRLPDGTVVHPDLGDPAIGFYIEIDDHEWHGGRLDARYDDHRDRLVRLGGGWVERVSTDDLRPPRPELVRQLVDAHRRQVSLSIALR
jgi:hypothetical protein